MAESSNSSELVDAMSATTAGVMKELDSHLKLAKKCMEEVQELSSREFNDGQCDYLVHKLDMAIQSASLFLEDSQVQFNGLHRLMPSARQAKIFELLVASAKQVESFVRSCSQDTWMHSAVTLAKVAAYISWLGFNLELCKIALNYGQASPESLTIDEVSKIHEDEVKVVEERASRDANILLKKVTSELNTPDSSENCKLAKYLVHLLVGVHPKPSFYDDDNLLLGFFEWVVTGKKVRQIGSGATAKVYKVVWLGIPVAKKTFYGPKNEDFLKEVKILSQLRHPNITSMFCCHINKTSCSIIMELMDADLCHYMIQRGLERNGDAPPFALLEGIDLMLQVGEGVNYLHEKRIVHRDLKSSNILVKNVEESGLELGYVQAKVVDFGLSKTKEHSMSYSTTSFNTGTCRWMAPEVINTHQVNHEGSRGAVESRKYVFKVDIYSFAMVCFEILTGEVPFQSEGKLSKVKEKVLKGERPIIPEYCPMLLKSLIEKCWSQNPTDRPCIGDVCKQLKYIKYLAMTSREDFMVSSTSMLETVQTNSEDLMVSSESMESDIVQTNSEDFTVSNKFSETFTFMAARKHMNSDVVQAKTSDHRDARSVPESPNTAQIEREYSEQRLQKLLIDGQQENQDSLLQQCVMQDVGFNNDRPIAACILYKSLLQWRSFEAERTDVFDRIIQIVGTAIESHLDNNDVLAYWLSNTSTLLFLLQRKLKASGAAAGGAAQRRRSNSVMLFGRMTQGYRASPAPGAVSFSNGGIMGGLDLSRQVEAKHPALLFKQQLTAYVEKIYGMVRDNLKTEIAPLLGLCIQAPRTSRASLGKVWRSPSSNVTAQQTLSSHWHSIISSLSALLNTIRANHVPPFLVRKLFTQIFSFINVQLFNILLLRRECCSFSNGEYVKAGLAEVEHWIHEAGDVYAGASWDELKYIRQAVRFLVIRQKPKKSLDEITHDLCPVLSVEQLYRISTMYWDDLYGTQSVSPEVIANMRVLMSMNSNSGVSNSYLLEDDTSIPFSVDDISKSMPEVDMAEVLPPPLLKDNPAFHFLMPQPEP